jgi:ABC-type glutathione transport system ATPase component
MLALALGHDPELLLLRRPDARPRRRRAARGVRRAIGELADRNTTVLVTTHDLAGVEGVADRVGILHANRLVLEGELRGAQRPSTAPRSEEIFAAVAGERARRRAAARRRGSRAVRGAPRDHGARAARALDLTFALFVWGLHCSSSSATWTSRHGRWRR